MPTWHPLAPIRQVPAKRAIAVARVMRPDVDFRLMASMPCLNRHVPGPSNEFESRHNRYRMNNRQRLTGHAEIVEIVGEDRLFFGRFALAGRVLACRAEKCLGGIRPLDECMQMQFDMLLDSDRQLAEQRQPL